MTDKGAVPEEPLVPPELFAGDVPDFWRLPDRSFEQICRGILAAEPLVRTCELYGGRGEKQFGVDLVAPRQDGAVEIGQCKNYQKIIPSEITKASDDFLDHWPAKWAKSNVSRFVLFIGGPLSATAVDQTQLEKRRFDLLGVTYEAWSAEVIADKLRLHPDLVRRYLPSRPWVEALCGVSELKQPPSLIVGLLEREVETLRAALSQETLRELEAMHERWQEGQAEVPLAWVRALRGGPHWNALSPEVKAKLIRFEAYLNLDDDVESAVAFAQQAARLDPSPADSVLEAMIHLERGQPEEALALLADSNDPAAPGLRVALLLEQDRVREAAELIPTLGAGVESLRLSAYVQLFTRQTERALATIQAAEAQAQKRSSVLLAGAVIRFYSSLSPVAQPESPSQYLNPSCPEMLLPGQRALASLAEAAATFLSLETQDPRHAPVYRAWLVACRLTHPADRAAGLRLLEQSLVLYPGNTLLLHWAARWSDDAVLERAALALGSDLTTPGAVLALVHLRLRLGAEGEAIRLLDEHKQQFVAAGEPCVWVNWYARCMAVAGNYSEALRAIDESGCANEMTELRCSLQRAQGDSPATVVQQLMKGYEETKEPALFLQACRIQEQERDWNWLLQHAPQLMGEVQTETAFLMAGAAAYNLGRFQEALEFVAPLSSGSLKLWELRIYSHLGLGQLIEALGCAEQASQAHPEAKSWMLLAQVYARLGRDTELALVARRLLDIPQVDSADCLQLAQVLVSSHPDLARKLWRRALEGTIPNSLVPLAVTLGFRLDLEQDPSFGTVMRRFTELAGDSSSHVRLMRLEEVKAMLAAQRQRVADLHEAYEQCVVPVHVISEMLRVPLASLYHELLERNQEEPAGQRVPVMVRSGTRPEITPRPAGEIRLNLDVTALLLAHHLELLPVVDGAFGVLRIPPATLGFLTQTCDELLHHQPAQERGLLELHELLDRGQLSQVETANHDSDRLVEQYGMRRTRALRTAMREGAFLLEPEPHPELSPAFPSGLPVVGFSEVIQALLANGQLTPDQAREASRSLRASPETVTNPIPTTTLLLTDVTVLSMLRNAGILPEVLQSFTVLLTADEASEIRQQIERLRRRRQTVEWAQGLKRYVSEKVDAGIYQFMTEGHHSGSASLAVRCLEELLTARTEDIDVIWSDDRFTSGYRTRDGGNPIVGSLEIVHWLRDERALRPAQFFSLLQRMRAAAVCYLPLDTEELLHYLSQARIEEGFVVETSSLQTLRRSHSTALASAHRLKQPRGSDPAEWGFLQHQHKAVHTALLKCFEYGTPEESSYARANWIWTSLYFDFAGVRELAGATSPPPDERLAATEMATKVFGAFAHFPDPDDRATTSRQRYLKWLTQALITPSLHNRRRMALAGSVLNDLMTPLLDSSQSLTPAEAKATRALMGLYFQEIPTPLQECLENHPELLRQLAVKNLVGSDDLQFVDEELFRALATLARNPEQPIELHDHLGKPARLKVEPGRPGVLIQVEGRSIPWDAALLDLLSDDASRHEKFLEQYAGWFDCCPAERVSQLEEMVKERDPVARGRLGVELLDTSPAVRYSRLLAELSLASHDRALLDPQPALRLLRRYRLDEATGEDSFVLRLTWAADRLIQEDLWLALERLTCFPVPLPQQLKEAFGAMALGPRRAFARRAVRDLRSPLSRFHLAHLLVGCSDPALIKLGWRLAKRYLSPKGRAEIAAFLIILSWAYDAIASEMEDRPECLRLALSWSHAEEIARRLCAARVIPESVREVFLGLRRTGQLWAGFERLGLENDVAHPKDLRAGTFAVAGLVYASGSTTVPEEIRDRLAELLLPYGPDHLELLGGAWSPNCLGAFLTLPQALQSILPTNLASQLTPEGLEALFVDALKLCHETPAEHQGWLILYCLLRKSDPPERIRDRVSKLLDVLPLKCLLSGEEQEWSGQLLVLTETFQRASSAAREGFFQKVLDWLPEGEPSPEASYTLLEVLMRLATGEANQEAAVLAFASRTLRLVERSPALADDFAMVLTSFCSVLSPAMVGPAWRTLVQLRAW